MKNPHPPDHATRLALILCAVGAVAGLAACGRAPAPPVTHPNQPLSSGGNDTLFPAKNATVPNNSGSQRQRQAEFLNRLRQADPQFKTIDKAFLNEKNELGLVLDRSVQMDDIPKLMRAMLTQLAKEFPGQDLNVVAYGPSNPPTEIATGHLDARTRDMTYNIKRR